MSEKFENILTSAEYLKSLYPKGFKPEIALITCEYYNFPDSVKYNNEILFSEIPPELSSAGKKSKGKILISKAGGKDLLIVKGRFNFYDGISMKDIGHVIYTLKHSGVKIIIGIDEVGHLDPRMSEGDFCFIYDHINLMGDNPLIGPNDNKLGVRFPDMSDCYDSKLLKKIENVVIKNRVKYNERIYLGTTGPMSETEAEARFYREIGADVVGYSIVPENITAVHAGLKFIGIGLISHHLIADKIAEEIRTETKIEKDRKASRKRANDRLNEILIDIVKSI